MSYWPASNVREKHSALVRNIGTYPEEDKANDLLENLVLALPVLVMATTFFDALLAAVYLKWFHPWKIILQEVGFHFLNRFYPCFQFDFMLLLIYRSQTSGNILRREGGMTR